MTDREERQHVIEVLQNMVDWMQEIDDIATPERIHALFYAIASIKTDLKYDLLYEETSEQADNPTTKNDLGVDAVSRQEVLYLIADNDLSMGQVVRGIHALPPVTPIRPKGHWIPTYGNVKCSACGHTEEARGVGKATHYCSFCGADMREVVEE